MHLLFFGSIDCYVGAKKATDDFENMFKAKQTQCLQWLYDEDVNIEHKGFLKDLQKKIKVIEDDWGPETDVKFTHHKKKFLREALDGFFKGCVHLSTCLPVCILLWVSLCFG